MSALPVIDLRSRDAPTQLDRACRDLGFFLPEADVERIIEGFGENAITDEDTGKTTLILDLPVVVFKQEGDALKPVQIKADIGKAGAAHEH